MQLLKSSLPCPAAPDTDSLGSNSLCLVVANLRQGDWAQSLTTMQTISTARAVKNYPVINHGR